MKEGTVVVGVNKKGKPSPFLTPSVKKVGFSGGREKYKGKNGIEKEFKR